MQLIMNIFHLIRNIFANPTRTVDQKTTQIKPSQYMYLITTLAQPIVVVDVGCRWGFAERFLSNEYRDKFKIFGFDPDQEECERLQAFYQHLPSGSVTCIPIGLAGANGKRSLHITKEPACSSLHAPIQFLANNYPSLDCITPEQMVTVNVTTIKQWANEHAIDTIDYIKIDTQGSELEILKGAEDLLDSVRCIDIEVEFNPIYEGQTLFGETDTYLRSKGFMLWRLSNLVHYALGGEPLPLEEPNTMCFDRHRLEIQAYGGQLFWADARYIHSDVLKSCNEGAAQAQRDGILFTALGMHDVVDHISHMRQSS